MFRHLLVLGFRLNINVGDEPTILFFFARLITGIEFDAQPLAQLCALLDAGVDGCSWHRSDPSEFPQSIRGFLSGSRVLWRFWVYAIVVAELIGEFAGQHVVDARNTRLLPLLLCLGLPLPGGRIEQRLR